MRERLEDTTLLASQMEEVVRNKEMQAASRS